jgi:hypothetical protein
VKRAVLVLVAACSGDTDLSGVYKVEQDVASMPCGTDAPVAMPPAFLKFLENDFLGSKSWDEQTCPDATGTNCTTTGGFLFFGGLSEPIDNGWEGQEYSTSFSGTSCTMSYQVTTAMLVGAKLLVEASEYRETSDLPEAQCTTDAAKMKGAAMPCGMHELIDATKQ